MKQCALEHITSCLWGSVSQSVKCWVWERWLSNGDLDRLLLTVRELKSFGLKRQPLLRHCKPFLHCYNNWVWWQWCVTNLCQSCCFFHKSQVGTPRTLPFIGVSSRQSIAHAVWHPTPQTQNQRGPCASALLWLKEKEGALTQPLTSCPCDLWKTHIFESSYSELIGFSKG